MRLGSCAALLAVLLAAGVAFAQVTDDKSQKKEIDFLRASWCRSPSSASRSAPTAFLLSAALSPDGKYLALLNNGRGTAESKYDQSIAILDLAYESTARLPRPTAEGECAADVFLRARLEQRRQRALCIHRVTDRSGRKCRRCQRQEAGRHRQWHRGIQVLRRHA